MRKRTKKQPKRDTVVSGGSDPNLLDQLSVIDARLYQAAYNSQRNSDPWCGMLGEGVRRPRASDRCPR